MDEAEAYKELEQLDVDFLNFDVDFILGFRVSFECHKLYLNVLRIETADMPKIVLLNT